MNSTGLNSSSNFAYRHPKQEITPNEVTTSTRLRVFCSKGGQAPIPFGVEWKRCSVGSEQALDNHEGACFECSPLDIGAIIEARIKYEDEGHHYETTRRFGPVRTDPELAQFERSSRQETFRVKIIIENVILDLTLSFTQESIVMTSRDGLDYRVRLTAFPEIALRQDVRVIGWRMRGHAEALAGYFSSVMKKPTKGKVELLEIVFQSRIKRDTFLLLLRNFVRRKSAQGPAVKEEPSLSSFTRDKELNFSGAINNRKNSDNGLMVPPVKRQRLPVEKDKLVIMKDKASIPKVGIHQQQQIIQQHQQQQQSQQPHFSVNSHQKTECLNVFDEEDSNFLRQFTKEFSTDLPSKRQHALNLRESFVELEQKNMHSRSRKDLRLNDSEDVNRQLKQLKQQLEDARSQLHKLTIEVSQLRQQNHSLKQMLNSPNISKDVVTLRQKLEFFTLENKRLENERAQIIADKISTERKYQKEKQEKEGYRTKLISMGVVPNTNHNTSAVSRNDFLGVKESVERKDSRSPMQSAETCKIEPSRSTKDMKARKDSNNAKNTFMPATYSPQSPTQHRQQQSRNRIDNLMEIPTLAHPL